MPNYITIQCDKCHTEQIQMTYGSQIIDLVNEGWFLATRISGESTVIAPICPKCSCYILDQDLKHLSEIRIIGL